MIITAYVQMMTIMLHGGSWKGVVLLSACARCSDSSEFLLEIGFLCR